MVAMVNQRWISIRNIIIFLGNQISPKSEDFFYFGGHFGFKMAAIANQRWISIRNIIIYLETKFLNPPFFASMATVAKFVQPIPIFLAYLVQLDVDVVPIKFHQFLFCE